MGRPGLPPARAHGLTAHSLSRRVRDVLAGHLGAHRHLPVDTTQTNAPVTPAPSPMGERPVYSREDAERGRGLGDVLISTTSPGSTPSWPRSTPAPRNCNNEQQPYSHRTPRCPSKGATDPCPIPSPWSPTTATGSGSGRNAVYVAITLDHPGPAVPPPPGDRRTGRCPASARTIGDSGGPGVAVGARSSRRSGTGPVRTVNSRSNSSARTVAGAVLTA